MSYVAGAAQLGRRRGRRAAGDRPDAPGPGRGWRAAPAAGCCNPGGTCANSWANNRSPRRAPRWCSPRRRRSLAGTTLLIAAIAPLVATGSPLDPVADLFAVVGLLFLGTVALALAGIDTGTAFGGMGASREITIAALVEPTILLAVFALSIPAGSANLGAIVANTLDHPGQVASLTGVLAFVALVIVIIAETGRLPVDNPATHLELTMVHEAMVLEYAGPRLALVEWASGMRLTVLLALLANLFLPWGIAGGHPRPLDVAIGVARRRRPRSPCWPRCWPARRCSSPSCGCSGCPSCSPGRSCWPCSRSPPPTSSPRRREAAMTDANFATLIDLAAGGLLLAAVLIVWRRDLRAIVRLLAWQGVALAAIPLLRGVHDGDGRADRRRRRGTGAARGGPAVAAGPRAGRRAARPARGHAAGQHRQPRC